MKDESLRLNLWTSENECSYYHDRVSKIVFFINNSLPDSVFEYILEQGFRRSGNYYYQNHCPECRACLSYRIPLKQFVYHDWQKRILRKNQNILVKVGEPNPTPEKEKLYLKYQYQQHFLKPVSSSAKEKWEDEKYLDIMYHQMYHNPISTKEIELWDKDKIMGFAILDVAEKSTSAVYSVYDPDLQKNSLGSFMILKMLEWSINNHFTYFYLGFYIPKHQKMDYKARFKPAEILNPKTNQWEEASKLNLSGIIQY